MSSKKILYRPAPEDLEPPTISLLHQGDQSVTGCKPKIKQGVLETPQRGGTKLKTSTLKSSKAAQQRCKPVVICHNPEIVHSQLKASSLHGADLANDTVEMPKITVIPAKSEKAQSGMLQTKKSARKGRFGQSRYKQAAVEAAMKNLRKSSYLQQTSDESSVKKPSSVSHISNPSLQMPQNPGKTSTPTSAKNLTPDWNMSAIGQTQTAAPACVEEENVISLQGSMRKVAEIDDLEILYARYLQMHFLNSRVKKDMEKKSKQATAQLTFLHEKNSHLANEVDELEKEEAHLEYEVKLQAQVETRRNSLAPVMDKLSSAVEQYKVLADNLDAVRHSLLITGAREPDPDELEMTLEETRHLLGQTCILTNTQAPAIESMSRNADSLSKTCSKESKAVPWTKHELMDGVSSALRIASLFSQLSNK